MAVAVGGRRSLLTSGGLPEVFYCQKSGGSHTVTLHATASVLTVEDDPIVRADLRLILEDAGFDVVPDARDGVEAVELAREHRPDLILIDLNLPGLDGVEATRQILSERTVPIVALTGHRTGIVERALEAGAVAHVLKPFDEGQLVGTITDVLAERATAAAEAEQRHYLIMIESMVRDGYSEREIDGRMRALRR
jgi:Response regulator containing CheY-like receiver domain and AraC-type DNA-binding domain